MQDRKGVWYVTNFVHGIPFKNFSGKINYRGEDIKYIIREFTRSYKNPIIGYKGGNIERDILLKIGMRLRNLEDFGCPKYDILITDPSYGKFNSPCRLHCWISKRKSSKKYHCCLSEVRVFREWLLKLKEREDGLSASKVVTSNDE
ncbi:uncharacterized protein LOC143263458 [Megalopta genalis]